jgi:hypothetical protein
MDSRVTYQTLVKQVLSEYAAHRSQWDPQIASRVICDDEHGAYMVLDMGWDGDKYWHTMPIHVDVIDHKIWVQYDETEEGIATELIAAGVPKEDIVLGFHPPELRPYTEFDTGVPAEQHAA